MRLRSVFGKVLTCLFLANLSACSSGGTGHGAGAPNPLTPPYSSNASFSRVSGHHYAYVSDGNNNIDVVDITTNSMVGVITLHEPVACPNGVPIAFEAAVDSVTQNIYYSGVADPHGPLFKIDTTINEQTASALATGSDPYGVTVDESGQFVYLTTSGEVDVFHASDLSLATTLPIVGSPNNFGYLAAATAPHGHRAFVGERGNSIAVIDTASQTVVAHFALTPVTNPGTAEMQTMTISPSGDTLYIAHSGADELLAIDAGTGAMRWRAAMTGPYATAVNHAGTLVYAAVNGNSVAIVDAATGGLLHTVNVSPSLSGVDVSVDDTHLYAITKDALVIFDATSGASLGSVALPTSFARAVGRFIL